MSLVVDKPDSLHGEIVNISAIGLVPALLYEVKLLMKHYSGTFRGYGVFRSDAQGTINVAREAPLRGTYSGIRPMGLFESLEPLTDFREGGYTDWIFPKPWNYELVISDISGTVVDSKKLSKNFITSSVERIVVEEGQIRGTIYKPYGQGPFPTILDMTGSGGGLREHRAALLASEGFCVLALAFFCYKDLPDAMTKVHVEYFVEAINWFTSLPYTQNKIGLQGNSFGGAIVLLLPKYCPQVVSVVSINAPHFLSNVAHLKNNGARLPFAMVDIDQMLWHNQRYLVYDRAVKTMIGDGTADLHPEQTNHNTAFRFVVSLDDQSTSSLYTARYYSERLRNNGHYVEVQCVPGGHLMETPYFPHHAACYSKFSDTYMAYGGEASLHGVNQRPVWSATVDFFHKTLNDRETSKL